MKTKLTVNRLAWSNLKHRRKQYTILFLGILLAMIFSATTMFLIFSYFNSSTESYKHQFGLNEGYYINGNKEFMEEAIEDGILNDVGYAHIIGFGQSVKTEKGITIAWADEKAKELSYMSLLEGVYPTKEGEIALEKSAVSKIDPALKVGDKFKVNLKVQSSEKYLPKEVEKEYVLVGILRNKQKNLTYYTNKDKSYVPEAFVFDNATTELGGKESLFCYLDIKTTAFNTIENNLFMYINDHGGNTDNFVYITGNNEFVYGSTSNSLIWGAVFGVILMLASAVVIVNAFNSNLKERKKQIGMLRAVGATKRQIISIFGREAFLISIISVPISLLIAYSIVKLLGENMGEDFVFVPDFTALIASGVVSAIFVMLASLLPLSTASRISPIQSIRNIEFARKMKKKNIKSKKNFNVSQLLSERNLYFYRHGQVTVSLFLVITIVISAFAFTFYKVVSEEVNTVENDYTIHQTNRNSFPFCNVDEWRSAYNENDKQYIMSSPLVGEVKGSKSAKCIVNITGFDEYSACIDYSRNYNLSREKSELAKREVIIDGKTLYIQDDYDEFRSYANIQNEMLGTDLYSLEDTTIKKHFGKANEGKVDISKLNTGEEVVLLAPKSISIDSFDDGLYMETSSEENLTSESFMAGNCNFKPGDEITITIVRGAEIVGDEHLPQNPEITTKTVKIGAIIYDTPAELQEEIAFYNPMFSLYTTNVGFEKFYPDGDYDVLCINAKDEITEESDKEITELLKSVSDTVAASIVSSNYADEKESHNAYRALLQTIIGVLILLLATCGSIINNSLTARIRESKREIGTLRAVGATNKVLTMSYIKQLLSMFIWGNGAGFILLGLIYLASKISMIMQKNELIEAGFTLPNLVLLPTIIAVVCLFVICSLNLYLKIKKETRHSIIENIREL